MKSNIVYGPPGTGKSTELLRRMKAELDSGTPDKDICFVSFTKAAAKELAARAGLKSANISTIHSLAFRCAEIRKEQVVAREELKKFSRLVGIDISGVNPEENEFSSVGDYYLSLYSLHRSLLGTSLEETYGQSQREGELQEFVFFATKYEEYKEAYGYVDFSDMLDMALNFPPPPYSVLFVDEAQDLSPQQWRLIEHWTKVTKVIHIAGDADQCQPSGTMVQTPGGAVPIESLKNGDKVISYSQQHSEFTDRIVNVASRPYTGKLVSVTSLGNTSLYTPNHKCMVKFKYDKNIRVVYLMRKGDKFRIGQTKAFKESEKGFSLYPVVRARQEKADGFWILNTFDNEADAVVREQILSCKYGIPQTIFTFGGMKLKNKYGSQIWDEMKREGIDLVGRSSKMLEDLGMDINLPNIKHNGGTKFFKCFACNLNEDLHLVANYKGNCFKWAGFKKSAVDYSGSVHSLDVEKTGTYVADGIYTHNSLYRWGGADPLGMMKFEAKHGPECTILGQSYRIPSSVHTCATKILTYIKDRKDVRYLPRDFAGVVRRHESYATIPTPVHGEDVLFLYRNHSLRVECERMLIDLGLPYDVESGKPGYFQLPLARAYRSLCKAVAEWKKSGEHRLRVSELSNLVKHCPTYRSKIEKGDMSFTAGRKPSQLLTGSPDQMQYIVSVATKYGMDATPTIRLSTIHGAKGREADRVVLLNSMSFRTMESSVIDPDSEARTFYVGVTRAKKTLDIVYGENPAECLR